MSAKKSTGPNPVPASVKKPTLSGKPAQATTESPRVTVRQLAGLMRHPPESSLTYHAYNQLRQLYILEQAARHFGARPDDPVPLYGKKLLDVGCGRSTVSQFLVLSGADITAIDPDSAQLADAEASAMSFGAPITFMNAKVESLLSTGETYQVILALDLLETSDNPDKMLWVLRQLLSPDGLLIISAIDQKPWAWLLHVFLSIRVYKRTPLGERNWQRLLSPRHLTTMAAKQGLVVSHLQFLRFNLLRQTWQNSLRHGTRYLMSFTAAGGSAPR